MLLGNYSVLHKLPLRFFGGTATAVEVNCPSNFNKSGSNRNSLYVSDTTAALKLYSIPSGNAADKTWMLPQKSGEMSSRNDVVMAFTGAGGIVGGITSPGAASFAVTSAAAGALIAFGIGSATMTISAGGTLLAVIEGAGAAAFAFATNSPVLGALASAIGAASFTVSGSATILPTDDTPPARTAAASFAFTAALTPYAIGQMVGSTIDYSVLTGPLIASSVWGAVAAENNVAGTMGNKLNSAASAGDPWGTALPGAYAAGSAGAILGTLVAGLTPDQATQLIDVWQRLGLDPASPLVTTATSIAAGGVDQTIVEAAGPTITVTRAP